MDCRSLAPNTHSAEAAAGSLLTEWIKEHDVPLGHRSAGLPPPLTLCWCRREGVRVSTSQPGLRGRKPSFLALAHLHGTNTITSGPEVHVSWSHVREPFKVAEVTPTSSLWYNAEPIWILLPRPEFESCPLLCNLWQDSKMPQGYLYN